MNMKKSLLLLFGAALLTGCLGTRYLTTGVNKYGTQYVVTHEGDTIYRETGVRLNNQPNVIWGINNPYWNNNTWGPRFVVPVVRVVSPVTTPKRTSNVATPRGSGGRTAPTTNPRGGGKTTQKVLPNQTGKKLFNQLCAGCHKLGQGMFIGPDLLELDEVDYNRIVTGGGGMPQWKFLGPANIAALEDYIESLR